MTATIDGLLTRANYPDKLLDKLCLHDSGLVASTVGVVPLRHFFD